MASSTTYTTAKIYPYDATPCTSDSGANVGLSNIANIYDGNSSTYAEASGIYYSTFSGNTHWRAFWSAASFVNAGIKPTDTIESVTIYVDAYPTKSSAKWSTLKYSYSIEAGQTVNFGSSGSPKTSTISSRTTLAGTIPTGSFTNGLTLGFQFDNTRAITPQLTIRIYEVYVVVTYTRNTYDVTFACSPNAGGSITGATSGTYEQGATLTATAVPATGYFFNYWGDGDTSPTKSWTVSSSATHTAYFSNIRGTLEVYWNMEDREDYVLVVYYNENEPSITFSPPTKTGYEFVGWEFVNNSGGSYQITDDGYTEYHYGLINGVTDSLTAVWEKTTVNKIYIGTKQPKEIYVGNKKVKAVYINTTKVYG